MKQVNPNPKILDDWFNNNSFYSKQLLEDETAILEQGQDKALNIFKEAVKRIPAYKDFLKKNNFDPKTVKTILDFAKIPLTTKENYISKYNIADRCWDGKLGSSHMVSTSSGTTGKPHFWPRDLQTEIEGAYPHELLLKHLLMVDKKKTLFIDGFAMGNWIAGTFTLACVNLVAWKGYPLTVMTPGYSLEAILETVDSLAEEFEQIIITGHTPFLKEVAEVISRGKNRKYKEKIILLGTGQSVTENWRAYILKLLNSKNYCHTFFNLYGSADAALMGFETPLSILIRKFLSENMAISKQLFNDERLPSLYNFDPRLTYFEQVEDSLVITKYGSCPLIRYNINDRGGVLSTKKLFNVLGKDWAKDKKISKWELPFVYLFGREKFMVKIYGANVYTEHVQHALNHEKLRSLLTGRYILEMSYDKDHNQEMICRMELNPAVEQDPKLVNLIQQIFVDEVRKINSEYNDALTRVGDKAKPKIHLHEHGNDKYFPKDKIKKTS